MEMSSENLKKFREAFKNAVKEVEDQFNVEINLGAITYDTDDFKATLKVANKGYAQKHFNTYAKVYGLEPSDYNRTFKDGRYTFTIVGIKEGTKYPIVCKRNDGKTICYDFKYLQEILKNN